jgi:hypothetical protein
MRKMVFITSGGVDNFLAQKPVKVEGGAFEFVLRLKLLLSKRKYGER